MDAPSGFKDNDNQEKEEDDVVTLADVLEEQNELEADANAVLGGADDETCTYSKGYLYRQPLYSCVTCNPPEKDRPAGICLACSYHCHEGHDLIELYTKRNFRCDCGNSLFPNTKCNLEPVKDETNSNNIYNQNFLGTYCTCKRPYPDPDDPIEDEMLQCDICEDWFHKRHLDTKAPEDFGEMICQGCMANHLFLWKYSSLCVKGKEPGDESLNVSVTDVTEPTNSMEKPQGSKTEAETEKNKIEAQTEKNKTEDSCYLKNSNLVVGTGSTFWSDGWRKQLCRCQDCLGLYEDEKVSFLLSETDTLQYYESKAKECAKESQFEKGLKALSSLDRVKLVEAIEGHNQMKTALVEYLQKFAENRKVVREEDIREFFTQMQAKKKAKVEIPQFCR